MPSIPGFEFPPVVIVQSTAAVASSGIENSKSQIQTGGPTVLNPISHLVADFTVAVDGVQFGDLTHNGSISAFQGPGNSGHVTVAKLAGSETQSVPLTYSNIIQNNSFESGFGRWEISSTAGGAHTAAIVTQFPPARGFDGGDPDDLQVPHGNRMLHIIKAGEAGYMSVFQTIDEISDTSLLRDFKFSVAPDSAFTTAGNPASRNGLVALQFVASGITQYTLAYSFTGSELPSLPAGFPSIDRRIDLTHTGADTFQRFTRDLTSDVLSTFDFTQIRLWVVVDMEDTLFPQEFDTLWDWFVLETGQAQPALFSTQSEEKLIVTSTASTVGSRNFIGIIGTRETYERDFDRSPFFFTPSEIDPNTVRDISEVEPFLLFSHAFLRTYEHLRATPTDGKIITDKGEVLSDQALAPENVVVNGSFETGGTDFWDAVPGTNGSITVRQDSLEEGGIPGGLAPIDGTYWAYLIKDNSGGSAYLKQTVNLSQDYASEIVKGVSWHAVFDFTNVSTRRNQFSIVFYKDSSPVYHLRYKHGTQGNPELPGSFPNIVPVTINLPATAGEINTYSRSFPADSGQADFEFNEVEFWWILDCSISQTTNTYVDDFIITLAVPSLHLLKTTSLAHVNTKLPVADTLPFAVSGTDQITQLDQTPPFFDETFPASGTSFNPTDGVLSFHIKDANASLDTTNLDVWANGDQIVNASTVQTSATWPSGNKTVISARDILYEFTRVSDYPQQSTVTVSGELADLAVPSSNQAITEYQFTVLGSGSLDATISGAPDLTPPVIDLVYPQNLDTQVSPNTDISWNLTDDASGVDPSTVRLLINGGTKIENDVASGGTFSRIANVGRGFDYVYNPDGAFTFGNTITGTVEASDFIGNDVTTIYEFTITPDDTLSITDFFLAQDTSVLVSSGTEISVSVEDLTHGVNVSGTQFLVDGVVPSGLVITTSGIGPDRVTYSVPSQEVVDNRTDTLVFVHAENNFPGPFPVIKEQLFVLRPGYDVIWPNRSTDTSSGAETVFPFITNIPVLAGIKNFEKNFNDAGLFYRFLTENQPTADLGAVLVSNVKTADLSASLNSLNTIFEYGKTIVLEVEVTDNEGNRLSFTHTFTIEDKPN